MTLSWNASTDNVGVTGYGLYRGGAAVGSTNASTRTYTFTGLSCGTTYTLAVDAVDAAGNRSTQADRERHHRAPAPRPRSRAVSSPRTPSTAAPASTLADVSGKGNGGVISGPSWTSAGKNGGALTSTASTTS